MLVLTREVSQEIVITVPGHEPIRVMLVEVKSRNQARIGIDASPDVAINRAEIQDRIDSKQNSNPAQ